MDTNALRTDSGGWPKLFGPFLTCTSCNTRCVSFSRITSLGECIRCGSKSFRDDTADLLIDFALLGSDQTLTGFYLHAITATEK